MLCILNTVNIGNNEYTVHSLYNVHTLLIVPKVNTLNTVKNCTCITYNT